MSRRRPKKKDASQYVQETLKDRIDMLMANRRKILAPFPIGAEEIYRQFWAEDEWHALQVLSRRRKDVFERMDFCYIDLPEKVELGDGSKREQIVVHIGERVPLDAQFNHMSLTVLPVAMQETIMAWAPVWAQYETERLSITKRVERVGAACTTYGQVFRLWPDLQGFFDDTGTEKINAQKSMSRYPDDVCHWLPDDRGTNTKRGPLKADWEPHVFNVFSSMIAECLMLPEMDDMLEVGLLSD